ncbi:MAG: glycosyltransferase [Pseudobutyrivibrio sp.]|nr:glycosyltransferase [Pseudobutyrivibrio sp.]
MTFLFFEMKTVCYNSYLYFANALSDSLKAMGHSIEFFRMSDHSLEDLDMYVDKEFDAIIDFNSDLPRVIMDDNSYFLDHVSAPFFDFILDHPLYHHDSLKHKIKNFNVICLDSNHKNYIEKYYPHIKSVLVSHVTGELAFGKKDIDWESFNDRPYDLLFSGTYTDPMRIETAIHKIPDFMVETTHSLIDMLLKDPGLTIESAVEELANTEIYDYINSNLPLHTQSFYLADAYVRSLNRKNLVLALDKSGYDFHLFGSLWDELDLKHAKLHREVPFNLSFTLFAKAKISVNIMPNFKMGCHDRVFSSQLNGAISLTDPTASLLREYKDMESIVYFDLNNMDGILEKIDSCLGNYDKALKIAKNGHDIASHNHTWANIANSVIEFIKRDPN